MVPRRLISSNIHHSTNITNMWQGRKSFCVFFFFFFGKHPYVWYIDDPDETQVSRAQTMGRIPWSFCEEQGFWIPIMLLPRDLLWFLSKTWYTGQSFAAGTVMNLDRRKFLSQTYNFLALWEPVFFVGRKHFLLCKLHLNTMSYVCWISFIFVHWVSTESDRARFQSIAQSQTLRIKLHDRFGTGLARDID